MIFLEYHTEQHRNSCLRVIKTVTHRVQRKKRAIAHKKLSIVPVSAEREGPKRMNVNACVPRLRLPREERRSVIHPKYVPVSFIR